MMFMKQDTDDQSIRSKGDERGGRGCPVLPSTILPGLEKLCQNFDENQQRIQNILGVK